MEKFCRACLTVITDNYQAMHNAERKRKQFFYVTGIRVSYDDVYPFEICEDCTHTLQLSSEFKKKCRNLDRYLKNYINIKGDWDMFHFLAYADDIQETRLDTHTKKDLDDESVCTSVRNFMSEIVKEEDICGSDDIIDAVIKEGIDLDDTIDSCWLHGNQNTSISTRIEKCFSTDLTPSPGNNDPEKKLIDLQLLSQHNNLKPGTPPKNDLDNHPADDCEPGEVPKGASTPLRIVISDKENDNDDEDKYKYECTFCQEKFLYFTRYQLHSSEIHNVKISRKPNRKPKTCEYCGKIFTDPSNLKRHLLTHKIKYNKTACEICKQDFKTHHAYKLHRRAHNTKNIGIIDDNSSDKSNGKYVCSICGTTRTNYPNLLAHQKKHKEKWPYSCNICRKPFYRMYDLNRHERQHTGEKPYECKVCTMKFMRSDKLMKHMRIHNDERPYVCIVCDQDFVSISALRQHKPQCKRLNLVNIRQLEK